MVGFANHPFRWLNRFGMARGAARGLAAEECGRVWKPTYEPADRHPLEAITGVPPRSVSDALAPKRHSRRALLGRSVMALSSWIQLQRRARSGEA
jgi:hypothetical protein